MRHACRSPARSETRWSRTSHESRPETDTDVVFVRSRAPFRAFRSHCAVSVIVDRAFARAGVTRPSRGAAHLLRHSVATSMLRHGASLQDVAALLRHQSVTTTRDLRQGRCEGAAHDRAAVAGGAAVISRRRRLVCRGSARRRLRLPIGSAPARKLRGVFRCKSRVVCPCVPRHRMGRARLNRCPSVPVGSVIVIRLARYLRAEDLHHEVPPAVFGAEKRSRPAAVHPLTGSDSSADSGGVAFRVPDASARHVQHAVCPARVHGVARVRGHPPPIRRHHARWPRDPVLEIPQEPPRPPARDRPSRARPVPPATPCVCARRAARVRVAAAKAALAPRCRSRASAPRLERLACRTRPRARPTPHSLRHAFAVRALQACPDGRDAITQHMVALSTYLGHAKVADTYWYLEAVPELMTRHRGPLRALCHGRAVMTPLAPHITAFFQQRLPLERRASATPRIRTPTRSSCSWHTPASGCRSPPSALHLEQIDAPLVVDFLNHLETARANRPSSETSGSPRSSRSCTSWSFASPRRSIRFGASWRSRRRRPTRGWSGT